ncbi:MAG: DnaA regulatory inactivator Hda [Methylotenera sp.]|nr:MAG: DnaA regulatory inactivator Hda [Methylotenera sp.]
MKQLLLDIQPPATPTLDNFVVGRNAEALFSLKLALQGDDAVRFIYLWGEAGSGKTHLINACRLQSPDTICVDDVQALDDADQIDLFNIYNQIREQPVKALIVSGTAAPTKMGLRDDLATRLAWGLTYQLHPLSDEEKAIALMSHAETLGMRLPIDVIDYCLRNLRRDLPTLISTVNALDEWSLTTKKPVTVPMLRQLLQLPLNH